MQLYIDLYIIKTTTGESIMNPDIDLNMEQN